ncbi:contact-dependent growth inhibition system immunity protein [uncultured Roseibium sp.]|uniref:contact-dependent growth inhibition system immunity protein n=1 Tax=uncultured Roseibium sp. TaxID=1936171 RepID=UPI00321664F4
MNDLLGLRPSKDPSPSNLLKRCEEATAKPLKDLDVGQIRLLITQDLGREYALPLAFVTLGENPFVQATHYRGDLLKACLELDQEFWIAHPDLWMDMCGIMEDLKRTIDDLKPDWDRFMGS